MLTVCTSSPESQWATLGDLMALLGTTASSSGMDKALTDATVWAERYITNAVSGVCRRQVYQETVAGYGSNRLMLARTPVLGVQRFFSGTDTGSATEWRSSEYRVENPDAGFLEMRDGFGFDWTVRGRQDLSFSPLPAQPIRPYLVVYEAGWQLAETSATGSDYATTTTGRTLPEDVERAVLLKAADLYNGGGMSGAGGGITRMAVGPLSVNYGSGGQDAGSDPVLGLLSPFRRLD